MICFLPLRQLQSGEEPHALGAEHSAGTVQHSLTYGYYLFTTDTVLSDPALVIVGLKECELIVQPFAVLHQCVGVQSLAFNHLNDT